MEANAERGAASYQVRLEAQQQAPRSDAVLEKEWWGPWSDGV